jgi:nucleoporin SEH1
MGSIEEFEPGHEDRVTVLHANYDGTRLLTASIDHRIKVWAIDKATGGRTLIETFTAHDADIRDARFIHPTMGSYIGTVAADLKFYLWAEDTSQAFNSGRRFRPVTSIPSTPRVPFASLDFLTVDNVYTYLALIDRQGLLSIYEPSSPDDLKEWTLLDQFHVCDPIPQRGDETSFKVRWDHNDTPLPYINSLIDDPNQLSLIVTSLDDVKIYHSATDIEQPSSSLDPTGASHRITFHETFHLPSHPALVRDVAWSSFNVRGTERIATACKDGSVRIFEIAVVPASMTSTTDAAALSQATKSIRNLPKQSSLSSALTGKKDTQGVKAHRSIQLPFAYKILNVATLQAHGDAWSVSWDAQGQVLMSGGSDGVTKLWRKSVRGDGEWLVFAEQGAEEVGEEDEES